MIPINLDESEISILKELIKRYAPESEVWAFGSRVSGGSHSGSDLDLVLVNTKNPNTANINFSKIQNAIKNSNLTFLVDIFDWADLPEHFKKEIQASKYILF